MWDLPGPGLEPVSAALAGGFLTTAPPGKSLFLCILLVLLSLGLTVGTGEGGKAGAESSLRHLAGGNRTQARLVTAVPVSPASSWALRCLKGPHDAHSGPALTHAPPPARPSSSSSPNTHCEFYPFPPLFLVLRMLCWSALHPQLLPSPTIHQRFAKMAVCTVTLLTGSGFPPVVIMLLPNRLPGVVRVQACFSFPRGSLRAGMSLPSINSSCRGPSGCGWLRNAC